MAAGILVLLYGLVFSWNFSLVLLGKVTELVKGEEYVGPKEKLDIYCRKGDEKLLLYAWKSIFIDLADIPSNSKLFGGENESEVLEKYTENLSSWFAWSWKQASISLPVFNSYCVGVASENRYRFTLVERSINYWKLVQLSVGIFIFFSAPALSRNVILYYITGMSFGVAASFLIIMFLISRMAPRKLGAYSIMFFGWSVVLYFFQLAWDNLRLLESYRHFIYGYVIVTAVISFALCYRYGPFTNYRTLNLIQWSLQLIASIIIFFSSEFREVPTVIIIIMLTAYLFPERWKASIRMLWRRYFPPKIKLLTEAEYINQANVETRKALDELRTFCQSPKCNAWKVTCQVKDPVRFSKFVLGESHLSDQEILDYDCDIGSLSSLGNDYNYHDSDNDSNNDDNPVD